jgi:hypothetical protein
MELEHQTVIEIPNYHLSYFPHHLKDLLSARVQCYSKALQPALRTFQCTSPSRFESISVLHRLKFI